MDRHTGTYNGMQKDSPQIQIGWAKGTRVRDVTSFVPCPNWGLIDRGGISDEEIQQRTLMLERVRVQMTSSPKRRLIPVSAWDELVSYSIWRAVTTWKGNGEGKCPLKNYAWRILHNAGIQWWGKNKHTILDCHELDRPVEKTN